MYTFKNRLQDIYSDLARARSSGKKKKIAKFQSEWNTAKLTIRKADELGVFLVSTNTLKSR